MHSFWILKQGKTCCKGNGWCFWWGGHVTNSNITVFPFDSFTRNRHFWWGWQVGRSSCQLSTGWYATDDAYSGFPWVLCGSYFVWKGISHTKILFFWGMQMSRKRSWGLELLFGMKAQHILVLLWWFLLASDGNTVCGLWVWWGFPMPAQNQMGPVSKDNARSKHMEHLPASFCEMLNRSSCQLSLWDLLDVRWEHRHYFNRESIHVLLVVDHMIVELLL